MSMSIKMLQEYAMGLSQLSKAANLMQHQKQTLRQIVELDMAKAEQLIANYLARGYTVRPNGDVVSPAGKVVDHTTAASLRALQPGQKLVKDASTIPGSLRHHGTN